MYFIKFEINLYESCYFIKIKELKLIIKQLNNYFIKINK